MRGLLKYVSVAHPRANGQVERINGLIIDGLKNRIFDSTSKKRGKWLAELPMIIWGLHTQPSKATGQTPFFLVYGSEAILPADIMWKSPRLEMYDTAEADGSRQIELDSLDEMRCNSLLQSTLTIVTSKQDLSTLEIWSFTESKMKQAYTVDAKINTLESEGKCSPSTEK